MVEDSRARLLGTVGCDPPLDLEPTRGGTPFVEVDDRRSVPGSENLRLPIEPGETECATIAGGHPIAPDLADVLASIPIGRPIANTRAYVLDSRGEPVRTGVPGELHLGGDGLALVYVARPGATAEVFVPDLFSGTRGGRLYKTGDRAMWLDDGSLEYLGLADRQVKIRGFRVEPGEIEAMLTRHQSVAQVAVVPRDEGPAGRRLADYIVPRSGRAPSRAELGNHLAESLPSAMIPEAIVLVESRPQTPNGKVDRRALAEADAHEPGTGHFVAPRDALEADLARIWEVLFEPAPSEFGDDFFCLGGHPLLAIRLVARLEAAFRVRSRWRPPSGHRP